MLQEITLTQQRHFEFETATTHMGALGEYLSTHNVSHISLEGMPWYVNPVLDDQRFDSQSFIQGYQLLQELSEESASRGISFRHHVMIDNFNNMSRGVKEVDSQVYEALSQLSELPIMNLMPEDSACLESSFHKLTGETACSHLDANFQYLKVLDTLRASGVGSVERELGRLPARLVMVHPSSFKGQQSAMLERLASLIRPAEGDNSTPFPSNKKVVRAFLQESYIHVWVHPDQSIEVTKPTFENGRYIHQPILLP